MRIGSRPARRGVDAPRRPRRPARDPVGLRLGADRVNLPGWFGLGSGLAAAAAGRAARRTARPGRAGSLVRAAYRDWPLLAVLLDNAEMSLAKTDRRIAQRYLALGGRDDLTAAVLAEYDLTRRLVLAVTGHDRLLANRRVLSRAVALRDPYVDALSHLQLRALDRAAQRATADRERLQRLLLADRQRRRRRPAEHRLTRAPLAHLGWVRSIGDACSEYGRSVADDWRVTVIAS